jgi:DNA polymerase III subunit epsilon
VAHNAAFDRQFWQAEGQQAGCDADAAHQFACTLLLARRLYPQADNHRLGTLAALHHLPQSGRAHRALADAEVTAHLLVHMQHDTQQRFAHELAGASLTHATLCDLQRTPRSKLEQKRWLPNAATTYARTPV